MKKMLTKMLAVAMAWAMLLSCTVMASATTTTTTPASGIGGEGELQSGTWGDVGIESSGTLNYASGHATGKSHNEGPVPSDVIRLQMPTVTGNALDMILDPHGLINQTKAMRYGGENVASFTAPNALYFLNKVDADNSNKAIYTDQTQDLTIENRSNVAVGVDLTLRVQKGSGSGGQGAFKFVSSTGDLKSSGAATMYLAIISQNSSGVVVDANTPVALDTSADSVRYLPVVLSGGDTTDSADLIHSYTANAPVVASMGTFQFFSSGDNRLTWYEMASTGNVFVTVEVVSSGAASLGSGGEHFNGDYPNGISVYDNGNVLKITATAGTNEGIKIQPDQITAYTSQDPSIAYVLNTSAPREAIPVTVLFYNEADTTMEGAPEAAMYFNLKAGDLSAQTVGTKATLVPLVGEDYQLKPAATATLSKTISKAQGAYVQAWNVDAGYYWAYVGDTDFATFGGDESAVDYDSLSFSLQGGIGGYDAWDTIGGDIKLDLIWDVHATPDKGLNGTAPTVTATSKYGSSTTAKTLKLTWTQGTGDYADYTPDTALALTGGSVASITMTSATTATGGTLTNGTNKSAVPSAAVTGTVTFKAPGKPDYKVSGIVLYG